MTIVRGDRHSKIIGQFGELFVCNMLSRSGFDVMLVDHIGIDIIAYRVDVGRIGISVKSRTQVLIKNEQRSVKLYSTNDDKLEDVCRDFNLEPWIAVYVETEKGADLYMTTLKNYQEQYFGMKQLVTAR